jgi:Lrp/AsnC family transcriptional regulator, leucine-responsive regulatory protein
MARPTSPSARRTPSRPPTAPPRPPAAPPRSIDERLLGALETDARLSYASLGERVGLSKTPAWARVRALESAGVITGYRAEIDPAAVGLDLHAFVEVRIRSTQHAEFELAVQRHPAVLECYTTAGQADYLLHVLVASIGALDALLRDDVSRMPGVERLSTTVGMKTIKRRGRITDCAAWTTG